MIPPRGALRAAALAMAATLSACAGFFARTPPHLYRLTSERAFPPALARPDARLLVLRPQAAPGLDTERIALTLSPIRIEYFADSAWTAPLPSLVRTALVQSFENSGALLAGDRSRIGLDPNFLLETEIRHFEAEYRSPSGPPSARVSLKVWLLRRSGARVVASASFESREGASANDVPHIVLALDEALDAVAKKIVVWIATNPALPAPAH